MLPSESVLVPLYFLCLPYRLRDTLQIILSISQFCSFMISPVGSKSLLLTLFCVVRVPFMRLGVHFLLLKYNSVTVEIY